MKTWPIALLIFVLGCGDSPQAAAPAPMTEHMGSGIVRTVEYWTERTTAGEDYAHERLVIETADRKVRQFDRLCEKRIAAWQGLEFKDMTFQYNGQWQCYHIIEFVR